MQIGLWAGIIPRSWPLRQSGVAFHLNWGAMFVVQRYFERRGIANTALLCSSNGVGPTGGRGTGHPLIPLL